MTAMRPMGWADVVAHRGASAYEPELTFRAFDLALGQGADVLELDVRATADGALVLVHDPTLERTLCDARHVSALDDAALRGLDAARRPLSFQSVLARYGGTARLLVDLKEPAPSWEWRVVDAIDGHGLRDRVVVQSFDTEALRRIAAATPWLAVTPLYPDLLACSADLDAVAAFAVGIGVWHGAVDAELVRRAHARGLTVQAWTVDIPEEMERLFGLGVDGLITNAPDVACRARRLPAAA
jgi:glycerophosphoryl diester phosphodiesterase